MKKNLDVYEKNKKYYVLGKPCVVCEKEVMNIGVVVWLDNGLNELFCLGCHKKVGRFRKYKSLMLARIVDDRPRASVLVLRPFSMLVDSSQVSSDTVDDCLIIDKTVFAGRESFDGFIVGGVSDPRALALDRELLLEDKKNNLKE